MEGIGDVPLGEIDGDLLGIFLPDSLYKSLQERAKLHGLGGQRLVGGDIYRLSNCVQCIT